MPKFQFFLPTKLTAIQRQAVDSTKPIFLRGVPGTGKTVVSIKRLQNAASLDKPKKAIIFTYGKLLKKTIEEKLGNQASMPVDNIHNWMWNQQGDGHKIFFDKITATENLNNCINMLQSKGTMYDEILVDEGQDLSINTYRILKEITKSLSVSADNAQQINNREEATNEEEIMKLLTGLKEFELDEIFRSAYELYRFAIQFVPYNARANSPELLERLKRKNSGADKPFVYLEKSLDGMFKSVRDIIDENPTDNIGVLFEEMIHVDLFFNNLEKDYEVSKYHSQDIIPSTLHNIIVTTFKSSKGVEFDIVIIPYFIKRARYNNEEYYVGVTRAKNQVHILSINEMPSIINGFDVNTYELIDNRG